MSNIESRPRSKRESGNVRCPSLLGDGEVGVGVDFQGGWARDSLTHGGQGGNHGGVVAAVAGWGEHQGDTALGGKVGEGLSQATVEETPPPAAMTCMLPRARPQRVTSALLNFMKRL